MPLERCTLNGRRGWRWGANGHCYTSWDGKHLAEMQGRAIEASRHTDKSDPKDRKEPRRLRDVKVKEVSLVDRPAVPTANFLIRKRDDGGYAIGGCEFVKAQEHPEYTYVWGPVLVPDDVDLQGDIVSASEIELAAHDFLESSQQVGLMHHDMLDNADANVVESHILKSPENVDGIIVPAGSWCIGVRIRHPGLRKAVREGRLTGFSIGGTGKGSHAKAATEELLNDPIAMKRLRTVVDATKQDLADMHRRMDKIQEEVDDKRRELGLPIDDAQKEREALRFLARPDAAALIKALRESVQDLNGEAKRLQDSLRDATGKVDLDAEPIPRPVKGRRPGVVSFS